MKPLILETNRLVLRPLKPSDAEAYNRYFNDWEIIRHLGKGVPWPYSLDAAKDFIEYAIDDNCPDYIWAITKKDRGNFSDELIGVIEVYPGAEHSHRGFWMAIPFQKQGLITEAATAITDFWFNDLGKSVMKLRNARQNDASRRIKEKNGARYCGVVPKDYMDPEMTEAEIWEITVADWKIFRASQNENNDKS